MSLRTDYTGALDTKLAEARAAGLSFISVTNLADLTTQMTAQADKGVKTFTVNYTLTYQPDDLRLGGCLWEAWKSGVLQALHAEDVMGNEVAVALNTSDSVVTSMDLNFTF